MTDKSNHEILEKDVNMKEEREKKEKISPTQNELLNQISKISNVLLIIKANNNKIKQEFTSYNINF